MHQVSFFFMCYHLRLDKSIANQRRLQNLSAVFSGTSAPPRSAFGSGALAACSRLGRAPPACRCCCLSRATAAGFHGRFLSARVPGIFFLVSALVYYCVLHFH